MTEKPSFGTNAWKKRIALFLVSQNLSLFGSSVVGYAILWHITLETSSGTWLMWSTLCSMVPQVVISLWAGVWADRYNRKYLIMISDGFIALSTLVLAVAYWKGMRSMGLLLAISAIRSLGAGIQTPAVGAVYPQLVPQQQLMKVQGINQTLNSVLLLLAPAAGGMVLALMGMTWVFLVDVFTALLAIAVFSLIPVDPPPRKEETAPLLTELKQGLTYTLHHPLLRRLLVYFSFSFFLITPAAILTPLMVERSFGNEVWRLTANELVWTAGSLVGGLYIALRSDFRNKERTVALCLMVFGVSFGLLGIAGNFAVYLTIMGLSGFFMPIIATAQTVLIQEVTEPSVLGRVFSIIQILSVSAMPMAILLFGPLADVVSVELILVVSGVVLTLVGVFYHKSIQRLEEKAVSSLPGGSTESE